MKNNCREFESDHQILTSNPTYSQLPAQFYRAANRNVTGNASDGVNSKKRRVCQFRCYTVLIRIGNEKFTSLRMVPVDTIKD